MTDLDLSNAQVRTDSKTPGMVPIEIGTMANVIGIACNIRGLTPAQRAARDAA
jgi:hypothetical protein